MDWLYGAFDTWDLVMVTIISLVGAYIYFNYHRTDSSTSSSTNNQSISAFNAAASNVPRPDKSFLGRMKSENREILILFGSQTGMAEELAGRLAKDLNRYGKKPLVLDPEEIEVENLPKITEVKNAFLLLCVATYGEGDPTDNAKELHEFLTNNDCDLTGLSYTVFGLGNKTYEHFNEIGKFFDKRLEELGAKRIFELGLGDDDSNLEEDFMRWSEAFLSTLTQTFGWELTNSGQERQYRLEIVKEPTNVFMGEYGRVGAFEKQRPPFDHKNPYLSTVVVNQELHTDSSGRSCRHLEFKIDPTRVRYEAGDHIGIFPKNNPDLVTRIAKLLSTDLETVFKLINLDEESPKRYPFPCPCSYQTALTHYVDICLPVKSHVLKALVDYTTDEKEKIKLTLLSTANDEGLKEYSSFIQKERRSIVDILEHFPNCKPPLDLLLEMLPRLQPRYYSISSSSKTNSDTISVTALVTRYTIGDRSINGVCSSYMYGKKVEDFCPIFIRKSTMRLPHKLITPVLMIGPGTGFAPFRGFLQERNWQKQQGKEIGPLALFYGCRHPEQDYIYKEELKEYTENGLLTELHLAFSRFVDEKVYVQHKLWLAREKVWEMIQNGAHIYVCGDARNMARDVMATFLRIFQEIGQLDEPASQKLLKDLERQRRYQADVWS